MMETDWTSEVSVRGGRGGWGDGGRESGGRSKRCECEGVRM